MRILAIGRATYETRYDVRTVVVSIYPWGDNLNAKVDYIHSADNKGFTMRIPYWDVDEAIAFVEHQLARHYNYKFTWEYTGKYRR